MDTPVTDKKPIQPQHSTEAPCSANVRARIGGYDWQITCRSHVDQDDLINMARSIKWWNTWLDGNKAQSPAVASEAINIETPHATATVAPTAPPAPVANGNGNGNGKTAVKCVMLEVGTSYNGGKTQLKFNCDGMEHPLTYTKAVSDMVKLLQPVGQYTADHIVIGKKYPVNFMVEYAESTKDGKTYKNVLAVRPA